jgi:hypothetical protein
MRLIFFDDFERTTTNLHANELVDVMSSFGFSLSETSISLPRKRKLNKQTNNLVVLVLYHEVSAKNVAGSPIERN